MAKHQKNIFAEKKKRQTEDKFLLDDEEFWSAWVSKLLFTLISVKVWGLFGCTLVSTYLLTWNYIDGTAWLTFNTTIWALIFGMKEVFRISEGKDKRENALIQQRNEADKQLLLTQQQIATGTAPKIDINGIETVGEEPDDMN